MMVAAYISLALGLAIIGYIKIQVFQKKERTQGLIYSYYMGYLLCFVALGLSILADKV